MSKSWRDFIDDPNWPQAGIPGEKPEGWDLYDVLDHVPDPVAALKEKEGEVRIRFHPWTSRHGGHSKINKAFAHLVIPPVEISKYGILPFNKKISDIGVYDKWVREAGFVVAHRTVIREKVENWVVENLVPLMRIGVKLPNGLHSAVPILQASYVDITAYRKSRY